jgi:hypothetical protein
MTQQNGSSRDVSENEPLFLPLALTRFSPVWWSPLAMVASALSAAGLVYTVGRADPVSGSGAVAILALLCYVFGFLSRADGMVGFSADGIAEIKHGAVRLAPWQEVSYVRTIVRDSSGSQPTSRMLEMLWWNDRRIARRLLTGQADIVIIATRNWVTGCLATSEEIRMLTARGWINTTADGR